MLIKQVIGLVSIGSAGNTTSILKALDEIGAKHKLITKPQDLNKIDKLVLPGVGAFNDAMSQLETSNIIEPLKDAISNKPTLGICLGMQILSKVGFEYGKSQGLGFFDAEVKQIVCDAPVPHMGFNEVLVTKKNPLMHKLNGKSFYFMHSFEVVNYKNILSLTSYAGHEFVSAIAKDNIFGVQFHPEKSKEQGLQLFKNFIGV